MHTCIVKSIRVFFGRPRKFQIAGVMPEKFQNLRPPLVALLRSFCAPYCLESKNVIIQFTEQRRHESGLEMVNGAEMFTSQTRGFKILRTHEALDETFFVKYPGDFRHCFVPIWDLLVYSTLHSINVCLFGSRTAWIDCQKHVSIKTSRVITSGPQKPKSWNYKENEAWDDERILWESYSGAKLILCLRHSNAAYKPPLAHKTYLLVTSVGVLRTTWHARECAAFWRRKPRFYRSWK